MRTRTLLDLRNDVYKRTDRENATDRFTPAEVNEYICQGIAALRDKLIQVRGQDYFSKTSTPIVIVQGTTVYPLPIDAYSILSFRIDNGQGAQFMLEPFSNLEEAYLRLVSASSSGAYARYRILDAATVEFLPQPTPGSSIYVRYVPNAPRLIADSDIFDGFNGWEEFPILYASIRVATKDKDWELANALKSDLAEVTDRIKNLAARRDQGRPERVQDIRATRRFQRYARGRWGM